MKAFGPSKDTLLCVALFIDRFTIIAAIFRRDLLLQSYNSLYIKCPMNQNIRDSSLPKIKQCHRASYFFTFQDHVPNPP